MLPPYGLRLARSFALAFLLVPTLAATTPGVDDVVMVIHGGAGTIRKSEMTPEREKAYLEALAEALRTGHRILAAGGSSLDAVEATVRYMEDSPLFNAGRGAVFTSAGTNEFDACVMDGRTHQAGAVAAVRRIKNPVSAARLVMTDTKHALLVGESAEQFAAAHGIEMADSAYFYTKERWRALERAREKERQDGQSDRAGKFGTVGAVALDANGDIASATSTGGLTNKRWGRVGDTPIIGAGTYADNATCGVSCTGVGELFMRGVFAYRVSALMELGRHSLGEAVRRVVHGDLVALGGGGSGGLIALDKDGVIEMEFNTEGMYRGYIRADGQPHAFLYRSP
ncbi:MAG: isoaspartyl peptidase/L-asparaginase [Candidatus Krumholzibacteria bacterium]|nr:isoaspartyl peptidase/L-asparaginase [Candidatus Krumholzibacteria bacterium]